MAGKRSRSYELAQSTWQALRQMVWSPLKAALPDGNAKVWICPDGELSRIPLQLLPESDKGIISPLIAQLDSPRELFKMRTAQLPLRQPVTARHRCSCCWGM